MAYVKKVWQDAPNKTTPTSAANFNHMEDGIATADANATAALDRLDDKQDVTDNTLSTVAKTIVGAINELFANKTNTKVKGSAESSYRTGNVNITKANIGLENVDNTADTDKSVANARTWNGKTDDMSTNNTTDTWVPVIHGTTIQHRVIPLTLLSSRRWSTLAPAPEFTVGFESSNSCWIMDMAFPDGSIARLQMNTSGIGFATMNTQGQWTSHWYK